MRLLNWNGMELNRIVDLSNTLLTFFFPPTGLVATADFPIARVAINGAVNAFVVRVRVRRRIEIFMLFLAEL